MRPVVAQLPVQKSATDPRASDPAWVKARVRAERMAVKQFRCRADATELIVLGYIHRETLRLLGEPVTELWYGWGRTRNHYVKPVMPRELRTMLDAREAHQWRPEHERRTR